MKKQILLLGLLLLTSACQTATETSTSLPPLFPTETSPASSTPIPVTVTPQSTPTLEPTPTPLPRLFTNEFDSSLAGWVILQGGSDSVPNVKTENSDLILQLDSPYTWLYVLYGAQDYEDVHIETQFVTRSGSPAFIGLICRYSETDGWLEYNVSTDGMYTVLYGKWLANEVADYVPILSGSSSEIQPIGASQQIGLTCSDTILSLYVNQNLIRRVDVSSYELGEGKLGITASSFENVPAVTAFDWVKVSEP